MRPAGLYSCCPETLSQPCIIAFFGRKRSYEYVAEEARLEKEAKKVAPFSVGEAFEFLGPAS